MCAATASVFLLVVRGDGIFLTRSRVSRHDSPGAEGFPARTCRRGGRAGRGGPAMPGASPPRASGAAQKSPPAPQISPALRNSVPLDPEEPTHAERTRRGAAAAKAARPRGGEPRVPEYSRRRAPLIRVAAGVQPSLHGGDRAKSRGSNDFYWQHHY